MTFFSFFFFIGITIGRVVVVRTLGFGGKLYNTPLLFLHSYGDDEP